MASRGDMLVEVVTREDAPVGSAKRRDVLRLGHNFRVVHVLVLDGANQLLLQRLPPHHARHPGAWGSSVAGYVGCGESYEKAAARKLREELGVSRKPVFLGKTRMQDNSSEKFVAIFLLRWSGPLAPNPEDFGALRFVPLADVLSDAFLRGRGLTPTFKHLLRFVRVQHLLDTYLD